MKTIKFFFFSVFCLMAFTVNAQNYVDLGLPSGTKWKDTNEADGFYTYDEAVKLFGNRLPSKAQWEELKAECQWLWNGSGYKVTGPNSNSIFLPAVGGRLCVGGVHGEGSLGDYWSASPNGSNNDASWSLYFNSGMVNMGNDLRCRGLSVRLVRR